MTTLVIDSFNDATAGATIPAGVHFVQLLGRNAPFDGGGVAAIDVGAAMPSHAGKWQAPDGRWFKFSCADLVRPEMFGGFPQSLGGPDTAPVLTDMINFANIEHPSVVQISQGQWPVDSALPTITYLCKVRFDQTGPQPALIYKRYAEANDTKGVMSWSDYAPNVDGCTFIGNGTTASGGSFISAILPGASPNIGIFRLTNFLFSSNRGTNYNVTIDGSANNSGTPGYRSIMLTTGHSFGTTNHPWNLKSVRHVFATNTYSDTSGGTSSNALFIDGTSSVPSDDFNWMGFINGDVNISHLTGNPSQFHTPITGKVGVDNSGSLNVYGNIGGTLTFGANVSNVQVFGLVFGAISGPSPTGVSGRVSSAGLQSF